MAKRSLLRSVGKGAGDFLGGMIDAAAIQGGMPKEVVFPELLRPRTSAKTAAEAGPEVPIKDYSSGVDAMVDQMGLGSLFGNVPGPEVAPGPEDPGVRIKDATDYVNSLKQQNLRPEDQKGLKELEIILSAVKNESGIEPRGRAGLLEDFYRKKEQLGLEEKVIPPVTIQSEAASRVQQNDDGVSYILNDKRIEENTGAAQLKLDQERLQFDKEQAALQAQQQQQATQGEQEGVQREKQQQKAEQKAQQDQRIQAEWDTFRKERRKEPLSKRLSQGRAEMEEEYLSRNPGKKNAPYYSDARVLQRLRNLEKIDFAARLSDMAAPSVQLSPEQAAFKMANEQPEEFSELYDETAKKLFESIDNETGEWPSEDEVFDEIVRNMPEAKTGRFNDYLKNKETQQQEERSLTFQARKELENEAETKVPRTDQEKMASLLQASMKLEQEDPTRKRRHDYYQDMTPAQRAKMQNVYFVENEEDFAKVPPGAKVVDSDENSPEFGKVSTKKFGPDLPTVLEMPGSPFQSAPGGAVLSRIARKQFLDAGLPVVTSPSSKNKLVRDGKLKDGTPYWDDTYGTLGAVRTYREGRKDDVQELSDIVNQPLEPVRAAPDVLPPLLKQAVTTMVPNEAPESVQAVADVLPPVLSQAATTISSLLGNQPTTGPKPKPRRTGKKMTPYKAKGRKGRLSNSRE